MITVLLVTTWDIPCGIAEHSAYLKEAVEPHHICVIPWTDLHPASLGFAATPQEKRTYDLVHLNYHAALHSQWTPDAIRRVRAAGYPVVVTYHDTGVPNSQQAKDICKAADAFVVHEPYDDLEGNGRYWRQGVPGWSGTILYDQRPTSWCGRRPIVGTVGFPFPWKNYTLLCEASALAGWATLLIAPGATDAQVAEWTAVQPHLRVEREFLHRHTVLQMLSGCDATAFLYSCANTGTSGAIRQGIAARKPVLAMQGCRQFRDLETDLYNRGGWGIHWVKDGSPQGVADVLASVPIERAYPPMVALAHQDSWESLGARYAALYREVLGRPTP